MAVDFSDDVATVRWHVREGCGFDTEEFGVALEQVVEQLARADGEAAGFGHGEFRASRSKKGYGT